MKRHSSMRLPLTGRVVSGEEPPFTMANEFLLEVSQRSEATASSVRTSLRTLADWLQFNELGIFSSKLKWPLPSDGLTEPLLLKYRHWLNEHKTAGTARTYMSGVVRYFTYLEEHQRLPDGVSLGRLKRQVARHRPKVQPSRKVAEREQDILRMPEIVDFYMKMPLPEDARGYNRQLSTLRNRAVVQVMMSTAMRVHEVAQLDRVDVEALPETLMILGKGSKYRTVHFDQPARQAIFAYLQARTDDCPALFVSHARRGSYRLHLASLENVVRDASQYLHKISLQERVVVALLRQTDITAAELEKLRWCHFDEQKRLLTISSEPARQVIDLTPEICKQLGQWRGSMKGKDARPMFISRESGLWRRDTPLSALTMAALASDAPQVVKIFPDGLTPHMFRHYRAIQLLRDGVPLEVVQEYLGHADPSTTRTVYAPVLGANIVGEWLDKVGRSTSRP